MCACSIEQLMSTIFLDLHCALIVAISVQTCVTFLLPVALMELSMEQSM